MDKEKLEQFKASYAKHLKALKALYIPECPEFPGTLPEPKQSHFEPDSHPVWAKEGDE